ncbi:MAG: pantetheine-phosphate adenylyltransferase [Candidatus Paceibacterota bacterium]|jgi:cytidyltransferase-like protein
MKKVAVGGTFDILHKGHEALLKKAFSLGEVSLGLTSDNYAKRKKRKIKKFSERKKNLENLIKRKFKKSFAIYKIEDKFGDALKRNYDYIVVSPESVSVAREINARRKKLGKKLIKTVKVPFVLDKCGKPISSTRLAFSRSEIIKKLKSLADKKNKEGMARFGISPKNTLGISVPYLRGLAKQIGKNHELAIELWNSEIHEARLLAVFIADPCKLTEKEMESMAKDIDSWDICDQTCSCLFGDTPFAEKKIFEWTRRKREFVKRAGFVLMAVLAVHDKSAEDSFFERFFPIIKREAQDDRNFVRKAVNWALRQIGKRNRNLNKKAIKAGKNIYEMDSKSAKWIASNALAELKRKF